ncbi:MULTISPECIES: nitric oxide-sensing protein NosP [unclassified Marinobacter]|uniref:nitric oxide-sensing protein NosP n=1 Tax=unclassified Marinobacter TaxID=83889 RepID=UPI0026E22ACD|nr:MULTISPECIES: nitric oxide-sensing protein NosP [unclassified Marinobacter]MDO6443662.1 nitric oxide-sensing protein NosP [Marinobacter sp. 2_MG-2023]MDO6825515.1 nitric oxide-sensing protein NosP [Marinobacter sp. 1_MG-2023]
MTYDHFGAPVKSTQVALAGCAEAVQWAERSRSAEVLSMSSVTDLPPAQVASTCLRDPVLAAKKLASELNHSYLGSVLFFCSAEYDLASLGPALEQAFPNVRLSGCTSAGEITTRGYDRGSITAIGFDSRFFSIECALIREMDQFSLHDAQSLIDRLLNNCRNARLAPIKGNTFAITLLDGLSSREELVLSTLNAALGSIPQFGGSAGDDERLTNTHVFYNGRFYAGAATVLLVNTPLDFRVFSCHHMMGGDEKLVVTNACSDSRTVYELNAEPAADAYARAVGVAADELDSTVFALRPLGVKIGGHYFVRSIQRVNPDKSLTFYCAVETGIVMTAMAPGSLLETVQQQLEISEDVVGSPLVTIGCDCFLRRLEAELTGKAAALSDFLREHKVVGFNTYGEQFDGIHINQTFTGVVIGQPDAGSP